MLTHGGAFEDFPYTNFHELNLDWLLNKVKEYIEKFLALEADFKELQDNFDELKAWVEQYIDEELRDAVNAKLDEWLEDGTLEDLINGKVYNELLHTIPDQEEIDEYILNVKKTLVNWLERNHGGDYFAENQAITETIPITLKYATGKGYNGLYGNYNFITNDMFTASDGIDCHVCYVDCTTFVSLIQRNILWNKSPYYEMMVNNDELAATKAGLLTYIDTLGKKPYLTDTYGDITTYQEAFILDMSGNMPLRLSKITRTPATDDGEVVLELNDVNISNLQTGDIIWVGDNTVTAIARADRSQWYKAIHHDAIYVKSLDELNELTHNVKFKLSDTAGGKNPEYGYVVHCTNETKGVYENGIRIITLMDMMDYLPAYTETRYPDGRPAERGVFVTSGTISNTGADSRGGFYNDRMLRAGNRTFWRNGIFYSRPDDLTNITAKIDTYRGSLETMCLGSKGARLRATSKDHENKKYIYDANLYIVNGHYTNPTEDLPEGYSREFRNFPKMIFSNGNPVSFELYVSGFRRGGVNDDWLIEDQTSAASPDAGLQYIVTNVRGREYMRGTTDNGIFRNWQLSGLKELVGGINQTVIEANSYVDVEVKFTSDDDELSYNFLNIPTILTTIRVYDLNITPEQMSKINMAVRQRTTSGFTVRFFNANDIQVTLGCFWRAYD